VLNRTILKWFYILISTMTMLEIVTYLRMHSMSFKMPNGKISWIRCLSKVSEEITT
jgi:hypothetical protein